MQKRKQHMTSTKIARLIFVAAIACLYLLSGGAAPGATFTVNVAPNHSLSYDPFSVSIQPGDTVTWVWQASDHSVTSGSPDQPSGLFDSGIKTSGSSFSFTFTTPGTIFYYCTPHG